MTVKELYDWAVENNCKNLPLRIFQHEEFSVILHDINIKDNVHIVGDNESKVVAIKI